MTADNKYPKLIRYGFQDHFPGNTTASFRQDVKDFGRIAEDLIRTELGVPNEISEIVARAMPI